MKHSPKSERRSHYHSPPYLRSTSIGSLRDLKPFFDGLRVGKVVSGQAANSTGDSAQFSSSHSNQDAVSHSSVQDHCNKISLVESIILQDFLESSAIS